MKNTLWLLLAALFFAKVSLAAPCVETTTSTIGESAAINAPLPDDVQHGDLLVAAVMFDQGKHIALTPPHGWMPLCRKTYSRHIGMETFYRIAESQEATLCRFSLNKKTKWSVGITRISGAEPHNPVADSQTDAGRKGNVTAPDLKTAQDNTLILAYYTNRRDATYTPATGTTKHYDTPNTIGGLPSAMLASFNLSAAGNSGNKTAVPSHNDHPWIGMQIAINPASVALEPESPDSEYPAIPDTPEDPTLEQPEPDPKRLPVENGLWVSPQDIATLPMSGEPWRLLKLDADTDWGPPNLSDQEDRANVYTLSKALVYVRTGIERYRDEVIQACVQAMETENGGRSLALGRNLGAFCIAADLVTLPPETDLLFREWLRGVLTETMAEGRSLTECHEDRPNNWGTHAGGARAAAVAYLRDWNELDRCATIFKGYLGDRGSYADFKYGDLSWQADPQNPVGINPVGATINGYNVDGCPPDDQRRCGTFTWPPPRENYSYEAMQGALMQAVILHRAGYDVWNWEDKAILRTFRWLHDTVGFPAEGDDTWMLFIINHYYGTSFETPSTSRFGKNMTRTCWTHP